MCFNFLQIWSFAKTFFFSGNEDYRITFEPKWNLVWICCTSIVMDIVHMLGNYLWTAKGFIASLTFIFCSNWILCLNRDYTLNVYRLSTIVSVQDAQQAGEDAVRQVEHPLLSSRLYPLLQVTAECCHNSATK